MNGITSKVAVTSVLPLTVMVRVSSALLFSHVRKFVTLLGITVSATSVPASYLPSIGSGDITISPHFAPSPSLLTVSE